MTAKSLQMDKDYNIFQEDGLFGAKNQRGEIIIPPQYMEMQPFSCGLSLVRNRQYQYAYINITIKREIKSSWTWLEPGKKTVTLSGKTSPIHFTYQLDLPIGDNFVPITVKDKRGNVREYSYKITMVAVEDNDPDININNNIWN